jgi:hypothetical protein
MWARAFIAALAVTLGIGVAVVTSPAAQSPNVPALDVSDDEAVRRLEAAEQSTTRTTATATTRAGTTEPTVGTTPGTAMLPPGMTGPTAGTTPATVTPPQATTGPAAATTPAVGTPVEETQVVRAVEGIRNLRPGTAAIRGRRPERRPRPCSGLCLPSHANLDVKSLMRV